MILHIKIEELLKEKIVIESNITLPDDVDEIIFKSTTNRRYITGDCFICDLKPTKTRESLIIDIQKYQEKFLNDNFKILSCWKKGFAYFDICDFKNNKVIFNFYNGFDRLIKIKTHFEEV